MTRSVVAKEAPPAPFSPTHQDFLQVRWCFAFYPRLYTETKECPGHER